MRLQLQNREGRAVGRGAGPADSGLGARAPGAAHPARPVQPGGGQQLRQRPQQQQRLLSGREPEHHLGASGQVHVHQRRPVSGCGLLQLSRNHWRQKVIVTLVIIFRPHIMGGGESHNLCCIFFQILSNLHFITPFS